MDQILIEAPRKGIPRSIASCHIARRFTQSARKVAPDCVMVQTKGTVGRGEPSWIQRSGIISLVRTLPESIVWALGRVSKRNSSRSREKEARTELDISSN